MTYINIYITSVREVYGVFKKTKKREKKKREQRQKRGKGEEEKRSKNEIKENQIYSRA